MSAASVTALIETYQTGLRAPKRADLGAGVTR
jgi:hypothetical protein